MWSSTSQESAAAGRGLPQAWHVAILEDQARGPEPSYRRGQPLGV